MTEPKSSCTNCSRQILQRTANRNGGLCAVCLREQKTSNVQHDYVAVPPDPIRLGIKTDVSLLHDGDLIHWNKVEEALFTIASQYVRAFGAIHCEKTFHGVAFDCNADFAQICFCANTLAMLRATATRYKTDWPERYRQQSIEDVENELRWSLGDWEFPAMRTEGFSDAWGPIERLLLDVMPINEDDDDDEIEQEFRHSFLNAVSRSIIRLEAEGICDGLNRTADFRVFVADHDESAEDSWRRLEAIRGSRDEQ